jgi:regulator of nonsense transcripts 1
MEGAFTHLGNHLISDSAATINAGDDLSTIDPDESLLDGEYGRAGLTGGPRRRRHDDDDQTEVFDDDDAESMVSGALGGQDNVIPFPADYEHDLPAHACAYVFPKSGPCSLAILSRNQTSGKKLQC